MITQPKTKLIRYWKGDKAQYTGREEDGFFELRLLDGHRKGELVSTERSPETHLALTTKPINRKDLPMTIRETVRANAKRIGWSDRATLEALLTYLETSADVPVSLQHDLTQWLETQFPTTETRTN